MNDDVSYKELLIIADKVVRAALDLRNSGYDGPFIGDVTSDLFSSLAELERTNYFKLLKS